MKFIRQLSVIFGISFLAELMELLIPLPVAASVYGLVLMLAGLITRLIPLEKVENAADFLIEIMPILFVPPTVSVMTNFGMLKEILLPLTVICIASTVLVMAVTGRTAQGLMRLGGTRSRLGTGEISAAPGVAEVPEPSAAPGVAEAPEPPADAGSAGAPEDRGADFREDTASAQGIAAGENRREPE